MKARHLCAVLGVAIAVGTVVFMRSLVATNDHQATAVAERLVKTVPVPDDAQIARFALDYRPNGHVMQGSPLVACVATGEGKRSEKKEKGEIGSCVVTKALFAQRKLSVPPIGTELTLIGRRKTHCLKIAAVLDWEKPLRGYPNVFVSPETAATIDEDWGAWEPKSADELAPGFKSDAGRNFDRAKGLLLWAAALTALCLLVNSLFLSVEARRKEIAILRMVGLSRIGVVKQIVGESLLLTAIGALFGILGGILALAAYVACDPIAYPSGLAIPRGHIATCLPIALVVSVLAVMLVLKKALSVKPLEAASNRCPRKKHLGMLIAFACGFGAFVAVEVWGASLMSAFVPSPQWPDAIVSILPVGVSSFDIERLQKGVKSVRRIHELAPLQVNFDPLEELKGFEGGKGKRAEERNEGRSGEGAGRGREWRQYRNALLLGSDWLPEFKFVAGEREAAEAAIRSGDNCIITEMMARAHKLSIGGELKLDCGRGLKIPLKIVGIVDLNWHMVTSRGLVRGMNRMPVNTDGPVFVSFDTVEACDARPATMVKMTHLWLDYEPDFLKEHGVFEAGRIVEREIAETLGLMTGEIAENTVRLHARDEIADGTLAHGDDLIGAMARVPFIFIFVISLGFVAMLVASAEARKREFVVLRTAGATRLQLAKVLVDEALKIAGWGVFLGLAGGSAIGWLCTAGTRAAMANWGLPANFALPVLTVAKGALGAIVFALVFAVPSALALVGRAARR